MISLPPPAARVNDLCTYLAAMVYGMEIVVPENLWSLENALSSVSTFDVQSVALYYRSGLYPMTKKTNQ